MARGHTEATDGEDGLKYIMSMAVLMDKRGKRTRMIGRVTDPFPTLELIRKRALHESREDIRV